MRHKPRSQRRIRRPRRVCLVGDATQSNVRRRSYALRATTLPSYTTLIVASADRKVPMQAREWRLCG